MKWPRALLILLGFICVYGCAEIAAAPPVALAGRWRLNRELSEFPKEVAFGIETTDDDSRQSGRQAGASQGGGGSRGGGRRGGGGSRGGGTLGGFDSSAVRETEEDVNKIKELIAAAKNPATVLTIAQTETAVTITDSEDRTRVFRPTGKEETVALAAGPVAATTKWNGPQLAIQLTIRKDRIFRYLYSRLPSGQLLVETRLEEGRARDKADVIKRVYDSE
jgi:hypothetical protein